ncbi:MAG: P22 coat - protein 5 family protein [Pelolinea sp.]|nr:P22 coat - protein 5 family protein [Pelolinea sp.]
MSNTLTGLIPTIYEAADVVLRELTGFIPAVTLDASSEQAAKDQTVSYPVTPANSAAAISPAATGPDPSAQTVAAATMSINKVYSSKFFWEAEEQKSLGGMYAKILRDQFAQAMRVLINAVESDLAALYIYASRAYGTAGTTPFASTLADPAQVRKILADNGAPMNDLQLVINTTAGAALRTLAALNSFADAGSKELRERGILLPVHGFAVRESAQVKTHTKGAGTGYKVDLTAGYAAGLTAIHVDTGLGEIKAGDILTNSKTGRDTNKYVVKTGGTGTTGVDVDIVLQNPGLRVAWANNDDLAIGNSYAANMAFAREAIHLLMRVPAMPDGGDAADDVTVITDPQTGISFQVAMYRQYRRVAYEVGLAWGVKAVKPEAMAILLG